MRRIIGLVLSIVIGAVFIWSGGVKAWDPAGFAGDILEYRLVGQGMAGAMALYLPWLEVIGGVALVAGRTREAAAVMLMGMLAGFSVAMVSVIVRGLEIGCGCFGHGDGETSPEMALARNALLVGGLVGILVVRRGDVGR